MKRSRRLIRFASDRREPRNGPSVGNDLVTFTTPEDVFGAALLDPDDLIASGEDADLGSQEALPQAGARGVGHDSGKAGRGRGSIGQWWSSRYGDVAPKL
jgi:hypothetical protein